MFTCLSGIFNGQFESRSICYSYLWWCYSSLHINIRLIAGQVPVVKCAEQLYWSISASQTPSCSQTLVCRTQRSDPSDVKPLYRSHFYAPHDENSTAPHLLQPVYLWPPEPYSDCINFPNKNQSAEEWDKEEGPRYYTGQDTPSDWECAAVFIGNSLTGGGG